MLPCFVKSRFRFEHSSNSHSGKLSSYIASLYLQYFLSLPHSQNRHLPIYFIPNDLRTLAKTGGGIPPKSESPAKPGAIRHQIAAFFLPHCQRCASFFTKPSPAPLHHNDILHPVLRRLIHVRAESRRY